MAQMNMKKPSKEKTFEGGNVSKINAAEQLKRSVMSTMLWEKGFYESGEEIAERIFRLTKLVDKETALSIMLEAKQVQKLRHAPLLMAVAMSENGYLKKENLNAIITRADELSEFLSLYWMKGKRPISHQIRKGLALAFPKFNEYQLTKYDRAKTVKLKDVLKMVRPKPANEEQAGLWKRLISGELQTPDTWEVALSSGKDKKETFERMLLENSLGDLAFIRNLRNMIQSGVKSELVKKSFSERTWSKILPFQFVGAARYAPNYEPEIETAMLKSMVDLEKLQGSITILVDTSGSMDDKISGKSEMKRIDAASGLAILARELSNDIEIYSFNNSAKLVPARHGFALRDAIGRPTGGTEMWGSIRQVAKNRKSDLMIVITDEQTSDNGSIVDANSDLLAVINVAHYHNGVGYGNKSIHISGWSENVITYLMEYMKNYAR